MTAEDKVQLLTFLVLALSATLLIVAPLVLALPICHWPEDHTERIEAERKARAERSAEYAHETGTDSDWCESCHSWHCPHEPHRPAD